LCAEARSQNADVLVTGGGVQSNHVRQTAAAAAQLGIDAHVVLGGARNADLTAPAGNVLLDILFGATFDLVDTDDYFGIERITLDAADKLAAQGRRPYAIPIGGAAPAGVDAYADAARELETQRGDVDVVFVADGSG